MISAAPSISIETVPAAGTGVGVGVEAGISKLVTAELSGVTPPAGPTPHVESLRMAHGPLHR